MPERIGIRYCGGCNPRYDRLAALRRLQEALPQHRWEAAAPGAGQSLCILVCGCEVACASAEDLGELPVLRICSEAELEALRERLARY